MAYPRLAFNCSHLFWCVAPYHPLNEVVDIVESLEIGKTKILFRKAKALDESVKSAEAAEEEAPASAKPAAAAPLAKGVAEQVASVPVQPDAVLTQSKIAAQMTFAKDLEQILSTDKEMALIRIGIELEKVIAELLEVATGKTMKRISWLRALAELESRNVITPATAGACIQFRDVRNQLIHASGTPVPDPVVTSTIDSGIVLLQILSSILNDFRGRS